MCYGLGMSSRFATFVEERLTTIFLMNLLEIPSDKKTYTNYFWLFVEINWNMKFGHAKCVEYGFGGATTMMG